jgi:hypothetical protein
MRLRWVVPVVLASSLPLATPTIAHASCGADPSETVYSYKQMIARGSTGDDFYHRMILGRVVAIRDPGDEGGYARAVVAVGAHPTGFVPLVARVRFWLPPPGLEITDNIEFAVGERWVIIARHKKDGSYAQDGACGQTSRLSLFRFHQLLALAS